MQKVQMTPKRLGPLRLSWLGWVRIYTDIQQSLSVFIRPKKIKVWWLLWKGYFVKCEKLWEVNFWTLVTNLFQISFCWKYAFTMVRAETPFALTWASIAQHIPLSTISPSDLLHWHRWVQDLASHWIYSMKFKFLLFHSLNFRRTSCYLSCGCLFRCFQWVFLSAKDCTSNQPITPTHVRLT